MITKVKQYVSNENMLQNKDKVVIGVSGGADSVCLFLVMLELQKLYELELFVVHINHSIRGEKAKEDECYVKELCALYEITCFCITYNIPKIAKEQGLSEEEAGRLMRYQAFESILKQYNCNKIAIAHNKNDNAETILFHLFRGSGVKGLSGIDAKRDFIIRPLLSMNRKEIEEYLVSKQIVYCTDETNLHETYSRNKIRLKVLPYVQKEINKGAIQHIVSAGNTLREISQYIEKQAKQCYHKVIIEQSAQAILCIEPFIQEDIVIQKEVIRQVIFYLTKQLKNIDAVHIQLVLELLEKGTGKQLSLPYEIIVRKSYHNLIFSRAYKREEDFSVITLQGKQFFLGKEQLPIQIPGTYYLDNNGCYLTLEREIYERDKQIPKNGCTKWIDYDKIKNTVFLRTRKAGDFMQIGRDQKHKNIKALFVDNKIPREYRDSILLLADENHIIWVLGDRISEAYKVDKNTTTLVVITLHGGKENEKQN